VIVVCDPTILIGLAKIGKLHLLPDIFSKIYVPEEVFKEIAERGKRNPGLKSSVKPGGLRQSRLKTQRVKHITLFLFHAQESRADLIFGNLRETYYFPLTFIRLDKYF